MEVSPNFGAAMNNGLATFGTLRRMGGFLSTITSEAGSLVTVVLNWQAGLKK